jgi:hypothetical protein
MKKILILLLLLIPLKIFASSYTSDVSVALDFELTPGVLVNSGNGSETVTNNNSASFSASVYKYGTGSLGAQTASTTQSLSVVATETIKTLSFWAYVKSSAANQIESLFSVTTGGSSGLTIYGYMSGGNYGHYIFIDGSQIGPFNSSPNVWHYYQIDFTGTTIQYYLDSALKGSITSTFQPSGKTFYVANWAQSSYTTASIEGYVDRFLLSTNLYNGTEIPTAVIPSPTFTPTPTFTLLGL